MLDILTTRRELSCLSSRVWFLLQRNLIDSYGEHNIAVSWRSQWPIIIMIMIMMMITTMQYESHLMGSSPPAPHSRTDRLPARTRTLGLKIDSKCSVFACVEEMQWVTTFWENCLHHLHCHHHRHLFLIWWEIRGEVNVDESSGREGGAQRTGGIAPGDKPYYNHMYHHHPPLAQTPYIGFKVVQFKRLNLQ